MPRPSKLTPEVRKKLLEATIAGASLKDAAAYAGISHDSFQRYRQHDKAFAAEFERAEGTAAVAYAFCLKRAADDDEWRAAAWWLERRRPADWGRKDQVDVTSGGEKVNVCVYIPDNGRDG